MARRSGAGVLSSDEIAKLCSSPIQRTFSSLLGRCDPSQMTDELFTRFVIDNDDVERITNKQAAESKKDAARLLFLTLIRKAEADRSMRVVNALVATMNELDSGMKELANAIVIARDEALAAMQRGRTPAASSPKHRAHRDGIDETDDCPFSAEDVDDGRQSVEGDDTSGTDSVDRPEHAHEGSHRLPTEDAGLHGSQTHQGMGADPENFRYAGVTDQQLRDIAEKTRDEYLRLLHYLPDKKNGGSAFKLNDMRLDRIKAKENNFERMLTGFDVWVNMTPAHNCGVLYDFLYEQGFGTVAENVLKLRRTQ